MSGNSIGVLFKVTTWGESHGPATGAVVEGCPSGIDLTEGDIQKWLNRRRPGRSASSSPRREDDAVEILSGTFQGKTTGTPISLIIENTNIESSSYEGIKDIFRPGHGDFTYFKKYGIRDYRGGGRSSARETAARVAAAAVAEKIISRLWHGSHRIYNGPRGHCHRSKEVCGQKNLSRRHSGESPAVPGCDRCSNYGREIGGGEAIGRFTRWRCRNHCDGMPSGLRRTGV